MPVTMIPTPCHAIPPTRSRDPYHAMLVINATPIPHATPTTTAAAEPTQITAWPTTNHRNITNNNTDSLDRNITNNHMDSLDRNIKKVNNNQSRRSMRFHLHQKRPFLRPCHSFNRQNHRTHQVKDIITSLSHEQPVAAVKHNNKLPVASSYVQPSSEPRATS